jgi:hypothetical protein
MNNTAYSDQGQAIRQPATAIFAIDSADRYTLDNDGRRVDRQTPFNFTIYKGQSVLNGFIKRLALTELNMEWNVPNVNSYNNKFAIAINGPDVSGIFQNVKVEVPIGFYTPTELAVALEELINDEIDNNNYLDTGITADFKVVIDPKTLYIDISGDISGGVGNVVLSLPTVDLSGDATDIASCSIYEMLGLASLLSSPLMRIDDNEYVGPTRIIGNYASYAYTRYIDIVSDNLTKKQEVRDSTTQPPEQGGTNLLARIYIPGNQNAESRYDSEETGCNIVGTRPFMLYKEFKTPKYIYWDSREFINLIDIKLYDDNGRELFQYNNSSIGNDGASTIIAGNTAEFQLSILASEN